MPVTKTAKKALRQSIRRNKMNRPVKSKALTLFKKALLNPTEELLAQAYSALDKAAKKNIFHKNKASRLKSHLGKAFASLKSTK